MGQTPRFLIVPFKIADETVEGNTVNKNYCSNVDNFEESRNFRFIWNGLIHLADGSQWLLADPAREDDVTG